MTFNTKGLNPFFHSETEIYYELTNCLELKGLKSKVQEVYFYGAGCSEKNLIAKMEKGLKSFFDSATINVDHDLKASALACFEGEPVIACILGTGSNSCLFDGSTIKEIAPALGYILGDEGSGSFFGKQLLTDFLYSKLPQELKNEFLQKELDKKTIIESVYMKSNANVYIASFAQLLIKHKDLEYSQNLIKKGFQKFIDNHIKCFENYETYTISFVGSISSLLEKELKDVCNLNYLKFGKSIRKPLDGLVDYHLNKR